MDSQQPPNSSRYHSQHQQFSTHYEQTGYPNQPTIYNYSPQSQQQSQSYPPLNNQDPRYPQRQQQQQHPTPQQQATPQQHQSYMYQHPTYQQQHPYPIEQQQQHAQPYVRQQQPPTSQAQPQARTYPPQEPYSSAPRPQSQERPQYVPNGAGFYTQQPSAVSGQERAAYAPPLASQNNRPSPGAIPQDGRFNYVQQPQMQNSPAHATRPTSYAQDTRFTYVPQAQPISPTVHRHSAHISQERLNYDAQSQAPYHNTNTLQRSATTVHDKYRYPPQQQADPREPQRAGTNAQSRTSPFPQPVNLQSSPSTGRPLPTPSPRSRPESMPPPGHSPYSQATPVPTRTYPSPLASPSPTAFSYSVQTSPTLQQYRPPQSAFANRPVNAVSTPPVSSHSSFTQSPTASASPTSASNSTMSSRRPLPTPAVASASRMSMVLPAKSQPLDYTPSPKPVRPTSMGPASDNSSSQFVPLWKRSLVESPPQDRQKPEERGNVPWPSEMAQKEGVFGPGITPSRRALPSSPTTTPDLSKVPARSRTLPPQGAAFPAFPSSKPSLDNTEFRVGNNVGETRTPSPQYGIRDLPSRSRSIIDHGKGAGALSPFRRQQQLEQQEQERQARLSSQTDPQPPLRNQQDQEQSIAYRLASMSLDDREASPRSAESSSAWPTSLPRLPRSPALNINLDDAPPASLRRSPSPSPFPSNTQHSPTIQHNGRQSATVPTIPKISFPGGSGSESDYSDDNHAGPQITVSAPRITVDAPQPPRISVSTPGPPSIQTSDAQQGPRISISGPEISVSGSASVPTVQVGDDNIRRPMPQLPPMVRPGGMACGGCGGGIVGRIVSAMGVRWHPECFRCTTCNELLEHVSSYEHEGRPYCHLDYHEHFAPRCYHCKTSIVDERFITLDDPALGKRTYHEQHFFCAECGDPFLAPSSSSHFKMGGGELNIAGDGDFEDENVGFTVYRGHPYCEACHVRLRMPKCKRCSRSIREGTEAVEALGGKWCWSCFVCAGCEKPFQDPSFFQRDQKPYCEHCFSIIIKSEM